MFKKKFKVRVRLYSKDYYTIEYADYRFIRIWHPLLFWFSQMLDSNTECWSTALWRGAEGAEEAEKVAKTLNSFEDVVKYYEPYEKERVYFLRKKEEYYKKQVPYTSKIIK